MRRGEVEEKDRQGEVKESQWRGKGEAKERQGRGAREVNERHRRGKG